MNSYSEDEAMLRYMQMKEEYGRLNSYGVLNAQHRDALVKSARNFYETNKKDIAMIIAMLEGLRVFPALLQLTMAESDLMDNIIEQYEEMV